MGRAIAIDATATIGTVDKTAENVAIMDGAVLEILEILGIVATNIQEVIPALVVDMVAALVAEEVVRVDDVVVPTILTAQTPDLAGTTTTTVMDIEPQLMVVREKVLKKLLPQRQTLCHSHKYFLSLSEK